MIATNSASTFGFLNDLVMHADLDHQTEIAKVMRVRAASVAASAARGRQEIWFDFFDAVGGQSQLDTPAYNLALDSSTKAIAKLASAWKVNLLNPEAQSDPASISRTVTPVFDALMKFGVGAVDLTDLPAEKVNGVHLSAILRATARQKASIRGWSEALQVARQALRRDGKNAEKILVGLGK